MSLIQWMCKRNGQWCSSDKSIDSNSDIGWVEVQSAKGHTIAMVTDDGGGYTLSAADKEMERRAHLIAAAPELYEMLDRVWHECSDDLSVFAQVEIEKVLKKARGES